MRRRSAAWVATGGIALLMLPGVSGAAPLTSATVLEPIGFFRFCAESQVDIANIDQAQLTENGGDFTITSVIHDAESDFISSKSRVSTGAKTIITTQYTAYRDAGRTQPELIRCKYRTGESLSAGPWPAGSANNSGRFAVEPVWGFGPVAATLSTNPSQDQTCADVNQRTIDNVWGSLTPGQQLASPYTPEPPTPTLVTVPDIVVGDGPNWLAPIPALTLNGSVLQAPSRALIVPTGISSTPRLEGNHYCTLVAPEYLRDVLLGTATVS